MITNGSVYISTGSKSNYKNLIKITKLKTNYKKNHKEEYNLSLKNTNQTYKYKLQTMERNYNLIRN